METIKPFEALCEPDERQQHFGVRDVKTGAIRKLQESDIYSRAAAIRLHPGVPEDIRSHFATSLNLLAYSWYSYPFNVTAQFMAYVSVEYALKVRFPSTKEQKFRALVKRAIAEGLIQDSGFSHLATQDRDLGITNVAPPMFIPAERPYVEVLLETMPSLRNNLAHGSNTLHMNGASSVQICADFINQLFPSPDNAG